MAVMPPFKRVRAASDSLSRVTTMIYRFTQGQQNGVSAECLRALAAEIGTAQEHLRAILRADEPVRLPPSKRP